MGISLPSWLKFGRKSAQRFSLEELAQAIVIGGPTKSGVSVTWERALRVSAVFACLRVIAEGVAQVPLKLYQEDDADRTRLPAKSHPLYRVLHRRPNAHMTSFELRELMVMHAALTGNFFAFINRVGPSRKIVELIPLTPETVTVIRGDDWSVRYQVRGRDASTQTFPAETIWHVRGPSWDGVAGLDAVKQAREAIGLALATETSHASLHRNGARPGGLLSVEGNLDKDQHAKLRRWLTDDYEGVENTGKTMIVDRAAKFVNTVMTGVDAQHLETRKHQLEEICRFFRVMPIMVGYSDKAATYASAEQMFLAHVVHTLAPWYERIEQSIDTQLLTEADHEHGIYAKFVEEGLLRGALKDTAEYLTKLVTNGVMTRNEARAKLDLNPIEGLDEPLTPLNMVSGAEPGKDGNDGSA